VPDKITAGISHNREILLDLCLKINPKATMSLLASSRMELGWNYPKLNALFNAVTNYRNKMMKGIISSYKDYDQVRFLIVHIFVCN
jgi:hypothetical protein